MVTRPTISRILQILQQGGARKRKIIKDKKDDTMKKKKGNTCTTFESGWRSVQEIFQRKL